MVPAALQGKRTSAYAVAKATVYVYVQHGADGGGHHLPHGRVPDIGQRHLRLARGGDACVSTRPAHGPHMVSTVAGHRQHINSGILASHVVVAPLSAN